MTCAAQPFSAPCPPWTSQRQRCFVEKQPSTNHNPNTEFFLFQSPLLEIFFLLHIFFFFGTNSRGLGRRIHLGVEVTESSTNKQHHQSVPTSILCQTYLAPLFSPVTLARRRTTNSHVPTRTTLLHSYTIVTSVRRRDET